MFAELGSSPALPFFGRQSALLHCSFFGPRLPRSVSRSVSAGTKSRCASPPPRPWIFVLRQCIFVLTAIPAQLANPGAGVKSLVRLLFSSAIDLLCSKCVLVPHTVLQLLVPQLWSSWSCVASCRKFPSLVLEPPVQKARVFLALLHSRGSFSDTPARCSMKCLWGLELLYDSILVIVVSLVTLLASIVIFHCDSRLPNLVSRANSFSITMWSWPS
jgi:hypothetical protein